MDWSWTPVAKGNLDERAHMNLSFMALSGRKKKTESVFVLGSDFFKADMSKHRYILTEIPNSLKAHVT